MAVTIVNASDNGGYGYIEFTLDGTDYTGEYTSVTYLPHIANASWTYNYDLSMTEDKNFLGNTIYNINIKYIDSYGRKQQRHLCRGKGKKVIICSGEFNTRDGMIQFWKEVEKATES